MTFFEELNNENTYGVALKNIQLKKNIISFLCRNGSYTIADVCKEVNLSVPKVTNLISELIQDGLVEDLGKVESTGGRKPNLYGMVGNSVFFLGVDIKQNHINIGLTDLQKNLIEIKENIPYKLTNSPEALIDLIDIIKNFIKNLSIKKEKILGLGVNLSGRINHDTGYSYSFFNFNEEPLAKSLEKELSIKTFLENDSRAMAYGEFNSGLVKEEKNVLFLNLDHGIGMGVMINSQLYYGKSGFAGEFGHIPLFNNNIICQCGKKGCLETEGSGWALTRNFKEKVEAGTSSILVKKNDPSFSLNQIDMDSIIDAANKDDVLAIDLIADLGDKLGRGIALLINIFNPELVIVGGSLAKTGEYLILPIKSAINKYSLSLVNSDTKIKISLLGEKSGVIGACLLARNRLLNLD
ncbi:ROK family transcriptional regulator [Pedobacter glucosidilyticus]|uniref:ROK family transcriptional regulator n=1 Tax=Pedobacter glucosidilyticus TaxID=1122941 RepID=UPI0026EFA3C1|nr:ROK family transcriptional regulator [Pedobacter glucosidilyticus]